MSCACHARGREGRRLRTTCITCFSYSYFSNTVSLSWAPCEVNRDPGTGGGGGVTPPGTTGIATPGAAVVAVMPGVRSTPGRLEPGR